MWFVRDNRICNRLHPLAGKPRQAPINQKKYLTFINVSSLIVSYLLPAGEATVKFAPCTKCCFLCSLILAQIFSIVLRLS